MGRKWLDLKEGILKTKSRDRLACAVEFTAYVKCLTSKAAATGPDGGNCVKQFQALSVCLRSHKAGGSRGPQLATKVQNLANGKF